MEQTLMYTRIFEYICRELFSITPEKDINIVGSVLNTCWCSQCIVIVTKKSLKGRLHLSLGRLGGHWKITSTPATEQKVIYVKLFIFNLIWDFLQVLTRILKNPSEARFAKLYLSDLYGFCERHLPVTLKYHCIDISPIKWKRENDLLAIWW